MITITLTIPGAPRTKKNHGRRVHAGGRVLTMPSLAWQGWCDAVAPKIRAWALRNRLQPIAYPVNCAAIFYRDANRGDAVGFYQGLADLLEKAGIVEDDKWIVSWDGSRLRKDASRPRVELVMTETKE